MINRRLKKIPFFQSHELSLVAALMAWEFPLLEVNKSSLKKVIFTFEETPELTKAINSFWNGSRLVSPKKYFNSLREAKSRIYGS